MPKQKNWYFCSRIVTGQAITNDQLSTELRNEEQQGETLTDATNAIKVNVYFAVFLEDITVKALKLEQLGLLPLPQNQQRIKDFDLLKIHNKAEAIRLSIFTAYKAAFKISTDNDETATDPQFQEISFTVPAEKNTYYTVENLLLSLGTFQFNGKSLTFERGTLKVIRSKKTAI